MVLYCALQVHALIVTVTTAQALRDPGLSEARDLTSRLKMAQLVSEKDMQILRKITRLQQGYVHRMRGDTFILLGKPTPEAETEKCQEATCPACLAGVIWVRVQL